MNVAAGQGGPFLMRCHTLFVALVAGLAAIVGISGAYRPLGAQEIRPDISASDLPTPEPALLPEGARPNPFRERTAPELLDPGRAESRIGPNSPAAPLPPSLRSQEEVSPAPTDGVTQGLDPDMPQPIPDDYRRSPTASPISTNQRSQQSSSPFSPRLARAPYVLGDSFSPSLAVKTSSLTTTSNSVGTNSLIAEDVCLVLPTGGGATRAKIAENTRALPDDRMFLNYNHFHNAVLTQIDTASGTFGRLSDVNRFTLGFEKTFFSRLCSLDIRMPLVANNDFVGPGFVRTGSEAGNLVLNLKGLLLADRSNAVVCGMTCDLPTGGDVTAMINSGADAVTFNVRNQAVHLSPFVGLLSSCGRTMFHQFFIQCDVATNDNEVSFYDATSSPTALDLDEQTLLYLDYAVGSWIYQTGGRASSPMDVRGVAALLELHYTSTLEDADLVQISTAGGDFDLTGLRSRFDVVNMSFGLQTNLAGGAIVRLGGVMPLTQGDNRFFDGEFQAQLILPL